MHNSQSECILAPYPHSDKHNPQLLLTNLVAQEITAEQYRNITPAEALKYINSIKHKGGSFSLGNRHKNFPTYWAAVTKQNHIVLIKILPTQKVGDFQFSLKNHSK